MTSQSVQFSGQTNNDAKVAHIVQLCEQEDLDSLAELSVLSGGFVTDEARRKAWPILLGATDQDKATDHGSWQSLPSHKDEDQVKLDVDRSFVYYPRNESDRQLSKRQEELQDLIVRVLRKHPALCYFQGYHDIAQVFLLVFGPSNAGLSLERLSLLRIRDFMLPTFTMSLLHLQLLLPILRSADPLLERHVSVTQPDFAISSTLTMYAHQIEDYNDIARVFDFLIAQEAVVSIYLFAAIILSRRDELLEIDCSEPEMLHITMSKLPKPVNWDALIERAMQLFHQYPPYLLRPPTIWWLKISKYSVLKTTCDRRHLQNQTLEDGEVFFSKHSSQVKTLESISRLQMTLWRFRKPIRRFGLTASIVVLAWWLGLRFESFGAFKISIQGVRQFLRRLV